MDFMLRRDLLKTLMAGLPLATVTAHRVSGQPPSQYKASWDSLDKRPIPSWYMDAKFGIFIHWGVYSVPAYAPVHVKNETPYAEWYWHSLNSGRQAERTGKLSAEEVGTGVHTWEFHKRVYGADFEYPRFAPMFTAELFDPDQWADVFARSGA